MRVKPWAIAITAGAVLAAGGALWMSARRVTPKPLVAPVPADIQVKFEHIALRGRAEGNRRWELEARSVELTRDQRQTRLDGLRRATLYVADQPQLTARAAWAKLESPSRNMELGGGVEIVSPQGLALRTDSLRWRADQERLDSAGPVVMTIGDTTVKAPRAYYLARTEQMVCDGGVLIAQGANRLAGAKLTADLAAQTLEIAGGVRMRLHVAEGEELVATAGPLGAMKGLLEKAPKGRR